MGVKQKILSTIRGVLEYIYRNPLIFGFEIAMVSGILIYIIFERKKLRENSGSSESSEFSEGNNDFL